MRDSLRAVSSAQGRRHFTDEFKREAVALLVSSGRPLTRDRERAGHLPLDAAQLAQWTRRPGCGVGAAHEPASVPHSAPDPAVEISRLRRENDRLQTERDIFKKKLWRSSRNRRDEVPLDRGPPGDLAGACHVRGAERVAVGLPRVVVTAGQPTQDRQSRALANHHASSPEPLNALVGMRASAVQRLVQAEEAAGRPK